jgi:hypothetical protein
MCWIVKAVAHAGAGAAMASAQTSRPPSELLDRRTGRWVLEGTIAGKTKRAAASTHRLRDGKTLLVVPNFEYL